MKLHEMKNYRQKNMTRLAYRKKMPRASTMKIVGLVKGGTGVLINI